MSIFNNDNFDSHELVTFHEDPATGLKAIIAVHDSTLGPAMGGCRMYPYASEHDAVTDVLRLSQGMTYKNSLAGLPIGGGKAVIIGNPKQATPELWKSMGQFVHRLNGQYITAEDSGTSVSAMKLIASQTPYVTGVCDDQAHAGDPSPSTALGVFNSMKVAVQQRFDQQHLSGLVVGIQGFGNVGRHLCRLLIESGVEVIGADPNEDNADQARAMGAKVVDPAMLMSLDMDVFAPCAMGAVLNTTSVPILKAGLVCGAANNQLATPAVEELLAARDILYAPDFAINSGGIIDAFSQYAPDAKIDVAGKISAIGSTLTEVYELANEQNILAGAAAIKLAKRRIEEAK